jgi:catechol 2,3-dioxygenase-like lactoylglutathione lyase family enzyme
VTEDAVPRGEQRGRAAQGLVVRRVLRLSVDHVVIAVSDWERSNAFYRDVLGVEVVQLRENRVAYAFGDHRLNVHGPGTDAGDLVAREPVRAGNSDLCFVWEGPIEAAVEHLRSRGVAVEAGPIERTGARGRGQSVYFRDPDGKRLVAN